MKFEVDIEEGDVIISNNQEWKVEEIIPHGGGFDLVQSGTGDLRNLSRDELQEMINFSGQFKLIKEEYIGL